MTIGSTNVDAAAKIHRTSIVISDRLPAEKSAYPVPKDDNRLLYIQRSMNSNTIVYTARFDKNGMLDAKRPIDVFWRRFNTSGKRKSLNFFERQFAFGVTARKMKSPHEFEIRFKALPNRPIVLRQIEKGKAALFLSIGKYQTRPVFLFLSLKEGATIPTVKGLKIFATDVASGKAVVETLSVSGGKLTR